MGKKVTCLFQSYITLGDPQKQIDNNNMDIFCKYELSKNSNPSKLRSTSGFLELSTNFS